MDLHAYPRTIREILGANRKYIIPRFQREYSWGEDELTILWKDIVSNLKYTEGELTQSEYFIGALVLVGDDVSDTEFEVVDGQQRITTITILFSALTEIFKNLSENGLVNGTYKYIEGKNDDDEPFVKLVNESPKPFFQFRIQSKDKEIDKRANGEEEEKLLVSYEFFMRKLSKDNLEKEFKSKFDTDNFDYIKLLKAIRGQVLSFKTVYITVSNIEEAYTIFETLNAKGKDLEAIDLIKNKIFKNLTTEVPGDYARETWKEMKNVLYSRSNKINISSFYRHYWLSKYSFTTESKLYEEFNKRVKDDQESYKEFLTHLNNSAKIYLKISNPQINDWPLQEEKWVYESLLAFNLFNTTQVRTFIIALFEQRQEKKIKFSDFKRIIKKLENFHFIFTAITSSRPSGLESKYSKFARKLRAASNSSESKTVIDELISELTEIKPIYQNFQDGFSKLYFTDDITKDKKIIQYILKKIELNYHTTDELTTNIITIEHLLSQSSGLYDVGYIGNLLPLDKEINSEIGNRDFKFKLNEFKKSKLETNKIFVDNNHTKENWNINDINNRTKELAKLSYDVIWNF